MSDMLAQLGITRDDVIDRAANKLLEQIDADETADAVLNKLKSELRAKAEPRIAEQLDIACRDLMTTPLCPVDEWGEPTRKNATTLRDMAKEKCVRWLTESVDNTGRTGGYPTVGTRAEWLAKKAAEEAVQSEVKQNIAAMVAAAKLEITSKVAAFIAEQIVKAK